MRKNKQTLLRFNHLAAASKKVRKESMRVNREFDEIESSNEDTVDLEAFSKRRNEPSRSLKQLQKHLKHNGLL
jgi:hypothetical protein